MKKNLHPSKALAALVMFLSLSLHVDATTLYQLKVTIPDAPADHLETIPMMFAYLSDGSDTKLYNAQNASGEYIFELPEGEYDIITQYWTGNTQTFLAKESIKLDKETETTLPFSCADKSVTFKSYILPDGASLKEYSSMVGTYAIHGGTTYIQGHTTNYAYQTVRFPSGLNHIDFVQCVSAAEANALFIIPFGSDSPEEINCGTESWSSFQISTENTPLYSKALAQMTEESIAAPAVIMSSVGLTNRNFFNAQSWVTGGDPLAVKVNIWEPANYEGPLTWSHQYIVNTVTDESNSILSPLTYIDENGEVRFNGENNAFSDFFLNWPETIPADKQGQPRYKFRISKDVILANAAPVLVVRPMLNDNLSFQYTYVGRYGEVRLIDSFNMSSYLPEYLVSEWGANHEIQMTFNGKQVCSNQAEFTKFNWKPYQGAEKETGDFHVTITDCNVKVDDMKGTNQTILTFNNSLADFTPPTLTMLSMRGKNDIATDRFYAEDGVIEFSAADFKGYYDGIFYYTTNEIEKPIVEYAPHGSDAFSPINAVEEVPELYRMPGWGYFFRARLSELSSEITPGWHDLRIKLTDKSGNTQTQLISPAFRIDEPAAIDEIIIESDDDSELIYFDLTGKQIMHPSKGIYIVKKGHRVSKVVL